MRSLRIFSFFYLGMISINMDRGTAQRGAYKKAIFSLFLTFPSTLPCIQAQKKTAPLQLEEFLIYGE